jgi:hypothetical protein
LKKYWQFLSYFYEYKYWILGAKNYWILQAQKYWILQVKKNLIKQFPNFKTMSQSIIKIKHK